MLVGVTPNRRCLWGYLKMAMVRIVQDAGDVFRSWGRL